MIVEGSFNCDVCGANIGNGCDGYHMGHGVMVCLECWAGIPCCQRGEDAWARRQVLAALVSHCIVPPPKHKKKARKP